MEIEPISNLTPYNPTPPANGKGKAHRNRKPSAILLRASIASLSISFSGKKRKVNKLFNVWLVANGEGGRGGGGGSDEGSSTIFLWIVRKIAGILTPCDFGRENVITSQVVDFDRGE